MKNKRTKNTTENIEIGDRHYQQGAGNKQL